MIETKKYKEYKETLAMTDVYDKEFLKPFSDWVDGYEHAMSAVKNNAVSPHVSGSLPLDPMVLAKYLHDNYEQIAKRTNWNTQKSCKVEFEDLPTENKNTMILLAGKLILDFVGNER